MENINNSYFDGYYKNIWRSIIPSELTRKEIDFIIPYFNLHPGDKVLDIMCGYGRHALGLAEKGIEVTAVDNLDDYIDEINQIAKKKSLPVKAIKEDVIVYRPSELFDLAMCMGNSLNFFNAAELSKLFSSISERIRKSGNFLINTWSLSEIAILQFRAETSADINEFKFLTNSKYLFHPTRIESETVIKTPDGSIERKIAIDYIYSVAEMESLLDQAGFFIKEIYSIPGKKKFTLGEPRAYIVAGKK